MKGRNSYKVKIFIQYPYISLRTKGFIGGGIIDKGIRLRKVSFKTEVRFKSPTTFSFNIVHPVTQSFFRVWWWCVLKRGLWVCSTVFRVFSSLIVRHESPPGVTAKSGSYPSSQSESK